MPGNARDFVVHLVYKIPCCLQARSDFDEYINETHLGDDDTLDVKVYGYEWCGRNRFASHRNAPKASGGVDFL